MAYSMHEQRSKRLQKELTVFKSEFEAMEPKLYALESTTSDLSEWTVYLTPGKDSMYHNDVLELAFTFPDLYPTVPLTARFLSNVYHPNVDDLGYVLGDSLRPHEWCPALNAHKIALGLLVLLDNPELDGEIANEAAASMYTTHHEDYKELAKSALHG